MSNYKKVLIIRFSSFGDLFHALEAAALLSDKGYEVHWVTRSDFTDLLSGVPEIKKVWGLNRADGFFGLIKLGFLLKNEGFTHIYDAHNNLRSFILGLLLRAPLFKAQFQRRSKERWRRFLLFQFQWNRFPKPYFSVPSFTHPIQTWLDIKKEIPPHLLLNIKDPSTNSINLTAPDETKTRTLGFTSYQLPHVISNPNFIALAPSAAWPLKVWPEENWMQLVQNLPELYFVILGGPKDYFCENIRLASPDNVVNLSGKLTLKESAFVISKAQFIVSGDTGLMHVANYLSIPTLALMGPSAFGFPHRKTSSFIYKDLPCQPCSKDGRGRCKNLVNQKCLKDISVAEVEQRILRAFSGSSPTHSTRPPQGQK